MKISTIQNDPIKALAYMERYVNEGSPSGFSFSHTSSPNTEPKSLTYGFPLLEFLPIPNVSIHNLGHLPLDLFHDRGNEVAMLVHPDMKNASPLRYLCREDYYDTAFLVQPTSSPRTLGIFHKSNKGFVKLHYENYLGRIRRRLTLKHAQSAIENTQILDYLISHKYMPESFSYYPETGARVYERKYRNELISWGMVWRSINIQGTNAKKIIYQIPGFSLFAKDMREPTYPNILVQLGEIHSNNRIRFLIDDLLIPLIENYFAMLIYGGLQGEWHSQNVLFGFDENWKFISVVLRDMESIDRDLPFLSQSVHNIKIESFPYKCIENDHNYAIRHSFMFDYKFGNYLLAPLIDCAGTSWNIDTFSINREITDFVMEQLKLLPTNFFPRNGCWYSFANQLIDQTKSERPYLYHKNPRFRRC